MRKEGGAGFPANVLHFGQLLSRGQLIELGRGRGVKMGLPLYPPPLVGWGGGAVCLAGKNARYPSMKQKGRSGGRVGGGERLGKLWQNIFSFLL